MNSGQAFTQASMFHDMLHTLTGRPVEDILIASMVGVIVFAWFQIIWR